MTLRGALPLLLTLAAGCASGAPPATPAGARAALVRTVDPERDLAADLDRIFDDPVLSRALVSVRIDRVDRTDAPLYARNAGKLVLPASNMKLLTAAVAADRLGWDYTFETRLEAAGQVRDGALDGNLVVTGSGDPSIAAQDDGPAALFGDWADALLRAGIRRVDGRLIGDDNRFDDRGLGGGWSWDDLGYGYAAPTGALSYNENVGVLRAWPGAHTGDPVRVAVTPPGHGLEVSSALATGAAGSPALVTIERDPDGARVTVRGTLPAGGRVAIRTIAVPSPTRFFVEALRLALASRGIVVRGGAWDIDDVTDPPASAGRVLVARRVSAPLSALTGYDLKVSQNFYSETMLRALAAAAADPGTVDAGRQIVLDTLTSWGVAPDAIVIADGSGLSRYDLVTADALVTVLHHVWDDERLRGPFVAALPIGGRDGTLENRMKDSALDGRVQAKTGTLARVRALSGYLITRAGNRLVFAVIVNNFTAGAAQVDAVVEAALARVAAPTGRLR